MFILRVAINNNKRGISLDTISWDNDEQRLQVINQFEALRRNGSNNMIDFMAVSSEANEAGFYHFIDFFSYDSHIYTKFLFAFGEYEHLIDEDLVDELVKGLN